MAYSNDIRREAMRLRKRGYSIKELSRQFHVAKSTAALWSREVILSKTATASLSKKITKGQYKGIQTILDRTKAKEELYFREAKAEILTKQNYDKIVCAMIYWCEGQKKTSSVGFTNSDPNLVKTFLRLFRKSFVIDETKFHPCIHLHSYHSASVQLDFWSKITDIDKQQFIKP